MKSTIKYLVIVNCAIAVLASSCAKQPVPCFFTTPDTDVIHVNKEVIFSAYCSVNAKEYFWEFYENEDSIAFEPVVTKYFKDTGEVKVSLDVVNGKKIARYTQIISVKP